MDTNLTNLKRPTSGPISGDESSGTEKIQKRRPTVYDAVAGKVTQSGFLGPKVAEQKRANQPLRPDEVLFKRINAPTRYEETDYYYAHRNLPEGQHLPDGDLLSALHAYVSKLYSRTREAGQQKVWKCMDETALIAMGILLEETAKEMLGETGDLALVEASRSDEQQAFADESDDESISSSREKGQSHDEKSQSGDDSSTSTLSDSEAEYGSEESV